MSRSILSIQFSVFDVGIKFAKSCGWIARCCHIQTAGSATIQLEEKMFTRMSLGKHEDRQLGKRTTPCAV